MARWLRPEGWLAVSAVLLCLLVLFQAESAMCDDVEGTLLGCCPPSPTCRPVRLSAQREETNAVLWSITGAEG